MGDDHSRASEAPQEPLRADLHHQLGRWQQRVQAVLEVLLCSSLPTQFLIVQLLVALGLPDRTPDNQLSLSFVLALSLTDTVVLIAMMVVIARAHGDSAWAMWRGRRPLLGETSLGVLLIPAAVLMVAAIVLTVGAVAPHLHNVPENPLEALARGGAQSALLFAVVAIVAGGIREELQRAFLLQRFERHLGGATAGVIVLAVAFGLGHSMQGWDAAIATGALGAFWAVVYLRRRSSIAPIISHAGFNAIEIVGIAMGAGA